MRRGTGLYTSTDSEVIAQLLARPVEERRAAPGALAIEDGSFDTGASASGGADMDADTDGGAIEVSAAPSASKRARTGAAGEGRSTVRPGAEGDDALALSNAEGHQQALELRGRIAALIQEAEGAYSFVVMSRTAVFGARDRLGLRPLCIGQRTNDDGSNSFMLASESCALGTVGAHYVREVAPGEIICIDRTGVSSQYGLGLEAQLKVPRALCVFEYVYFARPDSVIEGQLVHAVRQRLGKALARESPVPTADIVSGVPDSSIAAAIGYSMETGKPYTEVFCKNRYIGRTFIQPDDTLRKNAIHLKFNALAHNLTGRSLVLIDDSLVRGNTLRKLVPMLRQAGAREVHIRISSPPLRHPCYMGVDIGSYEELIAHRVTDVDAIRRYIGADSLAFMSLDAMLGAVREGIDDDISSGARLPPGEAGAPAAGPAAPMRHTDSPSMLMSHSGMPPVEARELAASASAGGVGVEVEPVAAGAKRSRAGSIHVLQGDAVALADGSQSEHMPAGTGAAAGSADTPPLLQPSPQKLGASTAGAAPQSAIKVPRPVDMVRTKSGMLSPSAVASVPPPPGPYGKLEHCSACFTGKYPLPVEEW